MDHMDKLYIRVGIIVILASIFSTIYTSSMLLNSIEAVGTVTSYQENGTGGTTYYSVVTFKCCNDKEIEFVARTSTDPPRHAIGEKVPIRFDPTNPEHARITHFFSLWRWEMIGVGIGKLSRYIKQKNNE